MPRKADRDGGVAYTLATIPDFLKRAAVRFRLQQSHEPCQSKVRQLPGGLPWLVLGFARMK